MADFNEFIAVDLETTGLNASTDEIIEIGAAYFVNGELKETFSELINPDRSLSPEIVELTGITDSMLINEGGDFIDVLSRFSEFIEGKTLVFHNGAFDTAFLKKSIPGIEKSFLDTKILYRSLYPFKDSHSLRNLSSFFDIVNENPHRALSDAITTGGVMTNLLKVRYHIAGPLADKLRLFCAYWGNDAMKQFFDIPITPDMDAEISGKYIPPGKVPPSRLLSGKAKSGKWEEDICACFDEDGIFASDFPKYEQRQSQVDMASDALEAMRDNLFLIAEAGTGTGKSFAYLLPAMLTSLNGEQIFISTRT
ncbi:MAG: hypothetical protein GF307_04615, partial [candidate division Zixibacteria bacterium]|nr:hypothetical protein [candidate division Zixibacteria bacterium]